jgi:hypothetical protein
VRHDIPEEPARRDSTPVPPSVSTGPLKNMDKSPPARKAIGVGDQVGTGLDLTRLASPPSPAEFSKFTWVDAAFVDPRTALAYVPFGFT